MKDDDLQFVVDNCEICQTNPFDRVVKPAVSGVVSEFPNHITHSDPHGLDDELANYRICSHSGYLDPQFVDGKDFVDMTLIDWVDDVGPPKLEVTDNGTENQHYVYEKYNIEHRPT